MSENPGVIDELESELEVSYSNNNKFTNTLAGAWASWAVSSFTSKLSLSKTSTNKAEGGKQPTSSSNPPSANSQPSNPLSTNSQSTSSLSSNSTNNGFKRLGQPTAAGHSMKLDEKKSDASDYEAWVDADDRLSLTGKESKAMNLKSIRSELDDVRTDKSGWEIEELNGFGDEKSDPWDSGEFSSSKGDSHKADSFKSNPFKSSVQRDRQIGSKENSGARSKASAVASKAGSKSKTLEDELFESLAEPSARKKRTGAMKLGAKKA